MQLSNLVYEQMNTKSWNADFMQSTNTTVYKNPVKIYMEQ